MTWKRFIIDGIFRSGKKHSNHEDDAIKMIRRMVDTIRKKFDPNVPIVIRMDSGYFDQKIFQALEDLNVGYIVGGVFFPQVKSFINRIPAENYKPHFGKKDEDIWEYYEFGDCRGTWNKFRRAIFFRSIIEEKRYLLPGTRPGTIVYTNLGMGQDIDSQLKKAGYEYLLLPEEVVRSYQQRGADELVHKTLKDFSNQRLPFQGFVPNSAVFHTTLIAFLLFESFKEDVGVPVIPVSSSPTTFRRKLLDIAGHFIKTGRKIILKVTPTTMKELNFKQLWERCVNAPPIPAWVY